MTSETGQFPKGFLWGVATSAYQIEGSPLADGAGPSIWNRFDQASPEGDTACDHYRRYREDVDLMARLDLGAYRFSLAWGRLLPDGTGKANQAGLDFYARLIDRLLEAGIQPCVTLYHWDLPAALAHLGGWLNPDIEGWFSEYASLAFSAYGDRVPLWTTLNEPWVITDAGYLHGTHAPGHASAREAALASQHLLRAHAAAVRVYRTLGRHQIGLVVNLEPKAPASNLESDAEAARRDDAYFNRQYLDPVLLGSAPSELAAMFGEAWPATNAEYLEAVREPLDFVGINYYTRAVVTHDDSVPLIRARRVEQPQSTITEMGWEVHPQSLLAVLCWIKERYGDVPLYITENGAAFCDPPTADESIVEDPLRVRYLRDHLLAVRTAIERGVDVRGYFVWSLFDNVEWTHGTSKRFGIVHVDFETQKRTLKRSAEFYRSVIQSHGKCLDDLR
jgi:beta-glucosidase